MPLALPSYNFRRVKGGGVLFVLLWNLLVFSYQQSALGDLVDLVVRRIDNPDPFVVVIIGALLSNCLPRLLYPFAGWLADAKLGRYKVMRYSLWAMWIGSALLVLTSTIRYTVIKYDYGIDGKIYSVNDSLYIYITPVVVIYLINAVGLAGYHVNVIPFGIDQMEGASGEQIASFVHWYYWTRNFNFGMILQGIPSFTTKYCKNQDKYYNKTVDISLLLVQMTFLTAAVCLDFIFSDKLHKDVKIHSTVKKVKDISTFVAGHSQPVGHRTAHTFTYEAPPSRSDFAKKSYGGPYKDEEVEEVMSFWRIVTVLLAVGFGSFLIENGSRSYANFYKHLQSNTSTDCYKDNLKLMSILIVTISIPVYEFLIYPFFRNHIPRTRVRIGVGMIIALLGMSSMLIVDAVGHKNGTALNTVCMLLENRTSNTSIELLGSEDNKIPIHPGYVILVIVTMAIGEMFIYVSVLEFICAQSPHGMRGLIIGIVFMIYGLYVVPLTVLLAAFARKIPNTVSCGTGYLLTVVVIGCVGTLLYIIAARTYKERQRGGQKDINPQAVVEHYYERSLMFKSHHAVDLYYRNTSTSSI